MANPQRGKVALVTDRGEMALRLTLGALAALEARLDTKGLVGVAERFESGAYGAGDLIALLTAGMRGGGAEVTEAEVAEMSFDGGAVAAANAAARLLQLTFRGM